MIEQLNRKKILAVDDSVSMRQMVCFILSEAGYNVVEAVDGEDAIDKMQKERFDLIITDLNMPKLDGIELIKYTRGNPSYKFIPILMLTTESGQEMKIRGKTAGATGWITKPFKPEHLLSVINRVL